MSLYRATRDTWVSHKGLLVREGETVDLDPLPKVPKYDAKGQPVFGTDGKPEMVEMRIGDNFEPVDTDDKPKKAAAKGGAQT